MNFDMNMLMQIMQGKNPQELVLNYLQSQMGNTPMGQNLLQLAKQNNTQAIEQIVRNMCQQKGINYDEQFKLFKQRLGLK